MTENYFFFLLGALFSRFLLEPVSEFVTSKMIDKLKK